MQTVDQCLLFLSRCLPTCSSAGPNSNSWTSGPSHPMRIVSHGRQYAASPSVRTNAAVPCKVEQIKSTIKAPFRVVIYIFLSLHKINLAWTSYAHGSSYLLQVRFVTLRPKGRSGLLVVSCPHQSPQTAQLCWTPSTLPLSAFEVVVTYCIGTDNTGSR
jgi:hypothetical protein